ncbi:stage V sporulation protein AA [Paratissierella segnis]|jgi:stage V sporulation protein AA|uniref:Stage V sporulation protein AA n=1 Tax=Paratissierella segnis TaxID=2763679 RepID=A0A926IJ43_9FIRM|nr:stage V sporulation protein AA [Paratissierella segnis]MBC8587026.1 stage V sporulation protein AA [Paratissierella segnis]
MESKEQAYIIFSKRYSPGKNDSVYIKDIAEVYCQNATVKKEIDSIKVYISKDEENWDYLSATDVIKKIVDKFPFVDISPMGATEIILEVKSRERENKTFELIKTTLICIVLFFGAAMGIMYFHEDVNMKDTLDKLYFTFTGVKKENPLIMTIPYSFGLGIGMVTFFKRVKSKSIRRRKEPGPLDIETYLYDKEMDEYILEEMQKRQKKE